MPKSTILSLNHFKSSPVGRFAPGTWVVEYHDRTHLPVDTYVALGKVEIEECTPKGDAFFWFRPLSSESLKGNPTPERGVRASENLGLSVREAWDKGEVQSKNKDKGKDKDKDKEAQRAAKTVLEQLSESIVRLGLMQPVLEVDCPEFIINRRFATVVLDTNALRDGAIRHLKEQFQNVQLWTIIPIVSLMEIGERVAYMNSKARGEWNTQNSALIRLRPQVTIAPQEVKWIKDNFPTETLELAPELLRTFRGYEARRDDPYKEPDRVSINDRLILEGIKDLRRQRGLPE